MNNKFLPKTIAAFLLVSASLFAGANPNSDEVAQSAGGIAYVSGGIGTESIDRLNVLAADFNLKLVFALKSGGYLSDVRVVIADGKGKTLIDATSEGPWFMTKLPLGAYGIVATSAGKSVKRQVAVGAARLTTVDFRWADE